MNKVDETLKGQLDHLLETLESVLDADVMAIMSEIRPGLEHSVRSAIEATPQPRDALAIVLHTAGGVIEVVERMVQVIRHQYDDVTFIIPDRAMSAGTVFAMSGDTILMDSFSVLGPIDPQIVKEDRLVPAVAYLEKFEEMIAKSAAGNLTTAEFALLQKLDLGELKMFEEARELSVELLKKWLTTYKFKNWDVTEGNRTAVTPEMRQARAEEIARELSAHARWHSHGRGISIGTLRAEPPDGLNLRIDDFGARAELSKAVRNYFECLMDYFIFGNYNSFIHTRYHF